MTNSINGLGSIPAVPPEPARATPASTVAAEGSTFHQRLLDSLAGANGNSSVPQEVGAKPCVDCDATQVETLGSDKHAELALQMMLQMRQSLLNAYQEIKDIRM